MMTTQQIRSKFVEFFKKRGHVLMPPSSLIPTDPSVLFTTAGMQQFKDWFVNPKLAKHKRVTTIQPCFRTSDIAQIGDETHLTYFEMLGHFSFNDYFKKEAIEWGFDFITKELLIDKDQINATYFGGEDDLLADKESLAVLKQFLPVSRIEGRGKADNFWGPTGDEGPCGPNIEFYVDGVEIWNSVFNQYYFNPEGAPSGSGQYTKLKYPGVDMGGGLERIALVVQKVNNIFETDELAKLMKKIPDGDIASRRVIADHVRAIDAIAYEGIVPSNKARGAVLRRLIRRVITHGKLINAPPDLLTKLVNQKVRSAIKAEQEKFTASLHKALSLYTKIIAKTKDKKIAAQDAFLLQESYGLPFELLVEVARKDGFSVDQKGFEKLMEKHRAKSRVGVEGKFKGGLVEITPETTRLHTAHHLLLAALRKVLGGHVVQRGSNITTERLRIDIAHQNPLKPEEITQVERLVNEWISRDLKVTHEEMSLDEAYQKGALGEFGAHYPARVSVYSILDGKNNVVSIEICGGPHVTHTGEIGQFKITKEESSGAGIRRIRATIQ